MAFGYFFGVPYTPPKPADPEVGEIWEYTDQTNPGAMKGQRIRIKYAALDPGSSNIGNIDAVDVDTGHERRWANFDIFKSGWRLLHAATSEPAIPPRDMSRFHHKCPRCKHPAYLGGGPSNVDCSSWACSTKNISMKLDRIGDLQ